MGFVLEANLAMESCATGPSVSCAALAISRDEIDEGIAVTGKAIGETEKESPIPKT